MPRATIHLESNQVLHHFSEDLVWSCRHHARIAETALNSYEVYVANMACIFSAASFLEARLNELTAQCAGPLANPRRLSKELWQTIHDMRKSLSHVQKWDLIASGAGGTVWSNDREPFQSYDLLVSLRNEMVHYKGEFGDDIDPPIKKIRSLQKRLNIPLEALRKEAPNTSWFASLLYSPRLGRWSSDLVDDFDMRFDHLIAGEPFTDEKRNLYALRALGTNPFRDAEPA